MDRMKRKWNEYELIGNTNEKENMGNSLHSLIANTLNMDFKNNEKMIVNMKTHEGILKRKDN